MSASTASPDIGQLRREPLAREPFPVARKADFRVFFAPAVHEGICAHAAEDLSVEVGGVLVGKWRTDEDGPFVAIEAFVRCDSAVSRSAEVTFTHETWAHINQQMDERYQELSIVGWYHTHPNFGIFLSDRDQFICEHFFSSPGQVAYVIDPVRKTEGVFSWVQGKPAICPLFWVGDRVVARAEREGETANPEAAASSLVNERSAAAPTLPAMMNWQPVLAYLAIFLVGYLLAGTKSAWEQQKVAEGAVAHYGIWKGLRPGLREELVELQEQITAVAKKTEQLASDPISGEKDAKQREADGWRDVLRALAGVRDRLESVEQKYGLSDQERTALALVVAEAIAGKQPAQIAPPKSSAPSGSSPRSEKRSPADRDRGKDSTGGEDRPAGKSSPAKTSSGAQHE